MRRMSAAQAKACGYQNLMIFLKVFLKQTLPMTLSLPFP
jgi:hypothetical protein